MSENPRWVLARRLTEALLEKYRPVVHAIGVHGSLAHGDDTDVSDIDLVMVTTKARAGPVAASRRIEGVVVDLGVIDAGAYLAEARSLRPAWPVEADQYLATAALYDPSGWHGRLARAHRGRLAGASDAEFIILASESLGPALSALGKATRLAGGISPLGDAALLEAATSIAVVEGLITRTYFRGRLDAVARTGLAGAELGTLERRISAQLDTVASAGHPLDAEVSDLCAQRPAT